jgi:hypothetical protein
MGLLQLVGGTKLVITPLSGVSALQLTPYSARGLTQTYDLIGSADIDLRRDVNAILQNVSDTRFRKYKTTISCKDGETPCLDDSWRGITVMIDCVFEFSYPNGATPARPVVSGSERTFDAITYYRPMLTCMIADIRVALPEYPAMYDWQIDALEV